MSIGHKMTATADETLHFRHHLCSITLKEHCTCSLSNHKLWNHRLFICLSRLDHQLTDSCLYFANLIAASRFHGSSLLSPSPPSEMNLKSSSKDKFPFFLVLLLLTDCKPITVKHYFTLRGLKPIVKLPFLFLPHYHFRYPTGLHRHLTLTFPRKEETPY